MQKLVVNIQTFFIMLRQLYLVLTKKQRRQSIILVFTLLAGATFETIGVSVVIPFVVALLTPEKLREYDIVRYLTNIFGVITDGQLILFTACLIIVCYIIKNLALLGSYYYQSVFHNTVERDLSILMLKSYLERPYSYYLKTNSTDMIWGVHEDTIKVSQVIDSFSGLFAEGLTCMFIGLMLIYMDPVMAFGLVGTALLIALIVVLGLKRKISESGEICRSTFSLRYKQAMQPITGYKEVAIYRKQKYFLDVYTKTANKGCEANTSYLFLQKLPARVIETVFIACLLGLACFRVQDGTNSVEFAALMGAMAVAAVRILPSISSMTNYMNQLVYNRSFLQSVYENVQSIRENNWNKEIEDKLDISESKLMNTIVVDKRNDILKKSDDCKRKLAVHDITWRYETGNRNVLSDISLDIKSGESIGIIGESGAGKSTLVNVILGLLKPSMGQVLYEGEDISTIPEIWAKKVGYVPQNVFLLDESIRNNIAFGVPADEIDEERINQVIKDAQLDKVIGELPEGLDTVVGEAGVRFSGGQGQRIAIARALYHNPEIVVLDEATSALDNETEAEVMKAIEGLHGKKTVIVIAHRLSTIEKCDRVFVLKRGKITDTVKKNNGR